MREKIAQEIGEWRWKDSFNGDYVTENDRNSCRVEAGRVLDLIKEDGYVKLAEDQKTPQYTSDFLSAFDAKRAESNFTDVLYDFGIQVTKDLLKAGWRKIELEERDG